MSITVIVHCLLSQGIIVLLIWSSLALSNLGTVDIGVGGASDVATSDGGVKEFSGSDVCSHCKGIWGVVCFV